MNFEGIRRTSINLLMGSVLIACISSSLLAQTGSLFGSSTATAYSNKRVNVNIDQADVRAVVRKLFESVGASYTLDPTILGNVTISLKDVPFDNALDSIFRATSTNTPVEVRIHDGIYAITRKVAITAKAASPTKVTGANKTTNSISQSNPSDAGYAGDIPSRYTAINNALIRSRQMGAQFYQPFNNGFSYYNYGYGNNNYGNFGQGYGYGGYNIPGYGYNDYYNSTLGATTGLYSGVTGKPVTSPAPKLK